MTQMPAVFIHIVALELWCPVWIQAIQVTLVWVWWLVTTHRLCCSTWAIWEASHCCSPHLMLYTSPALLELW